MTLILGIKMAKKLYLVSDTRLSVKKEDQVEYRDDIVKFISLNERISVVVAGDLDLARFIISELRKVIRPNSSASYVNYYLENQGDDLIKNYVNESGRHRCNVAFIFAGYNLMRNQKIESSRLGDALSAGVKAQGEGKLVYQGVDKEIIQKLTEAIKRKNGLHKGDYIEIDWPQSELISFSIDISPQSFTKELSSHECYEYVIFHPGRKTKKIGVPTELISELDFRSHALQKTGEEIISEDTGILAAFVARVANDRDLKSVGGNILVNLQTQAGSIIVTGELIRMKGNQVVKSGRTFVEDNKLKYKFSDGRLGEYHNFMEIDISQAAGAL